VGGADATEVAVAAIEADLDDVALVVVVGFEGLGAATVAATEEDLNVVGLVVVGFAVLGVLVVVVATGGCLAVSVVDFAVDLEVEGGVGFVVAVATLLETSVGLFGTSTVGWIEVVVAAGGAVDSTRLVVGFPSSDDDVEVYLEEGLDEREDSGVEGGLLVGAG